MAPWLIHSHQFGIAGNVVELKTPININTLHEMVNRYNDVSQGLGVIKVIVTIPVDPSVPSVIDSPRRVPHTITDDVHKELERMVRLGVIIRYTEPTPSHV